MLWTHLREGGEVEREGGGREGEEGKGTGRKGGGREGRGERGGKKRREEEGRNIDCVQRAQLDILMALLRLTSRLLHDIFD